MKCLFVGGSKHGEFIEASERTITFNAPVIAFPKKDSEGNSIRPIETYIFMQTLDEAPYFILNYRTEQL